MSVKLLLNWDIKPGMDQEYFEFVMREWVPGISKMGLEAIGAWYTVYSRSDDQPQMMTEVLGSDIDEMRDILKSSEWKSLQVRLLEYVQNYRQKVVHVTGGFQF